MKSVSDEMLESFLQDFFEAVENLENKYEISLTLGPITYSKDRFNCKLQGESWKTPEERERVECARFVVSAARLGIPSDCYGRELTHPITGEKYKVAGINDRAKKNKIVLQHGQTKFACTVDDFMNMLKTWI